ncbi:PAS domain S-box protein, partial [Rhizobium leguminosarum]|uniref:PAS domain S-box protein n=1 Tax=Rhizobium leguminosarum TaxID=384 RepID=UPI003F9B3F1E
RSTWLSAHPGPWNEGARRILGWDETEIIGQPAAMIFTEEDQQAGILQREMAAALTEGHGSDERWHVRKDGSLFWASGQM